MVELGRVCRIVMAHRDRLVRFGYGYFEAFCERHNTDVVVIDGGTLSPEQELVQDLVAILTVFSAQLFGLRAYKKAIRDMDRDENSAVNILTKFLARRGPHTPSGACGVLHADQTGVEVTEASCPVQVRQREV